MGLGSVILLKFFDWTTPEVTKSLWKSPQKSLICLKNGRKMLTLSFEEIQPNHFIQIGDDFNSKIQEHLVLYSNTVGWKVFEIFEVKILTKQI